MTNKEFYQQAYLVAFAHHIQKAHWESNDISHHANEDALEALRRLDKAFPAGTVTRYSVNEEILQLHRDGNHAGRIVEYFSVVEPKWDISLPHVQSVIDGADDEPFDFNDHINQERAIGS